MESASISTIDQYVSFVLESETFGVEIHKVREIIRYVSITRVPHAAAGVEGVINLRGRVIPVIDLRNRLGLPSHKAGPSTRIMVIEAEAGVTGFIVDEVRKVMRVDRASVESPPTLATNVGMECVQAVARLGDELLILIDLENVITPSPALAA